MGQDVRATGQGMGPERAERHRERTERCGAGEERSMVLFLLTQGVKERKKNQKESRPVKGGSARGEERGGRC